TALFLVFNIYVLGVDHALIFLSLAIAARLWTSASFWRRTRASARTRLSSLVHLLGQLMRGLGQRFTSAIHLRFVVRLECFLRVGQRVLHLSAFGAGDLVTRLTQHFLDLVDHGIELIASVDFLALGLVIGRVRFGVFRHALDFLFAQTRRRRNGDLLIFAGGVVFRRNVEDAVRVDVRRHLNLRQTTRSRWNSSQMELAQCAVLRRHRTLSLQYVYFDRSLIVGCGRECFRLARRNRRVARNHGRCHSAQRFNRQRQRSDVQQEQVFHFALEHAALDRRSNCHDFIRVYALVAFFAEQFFDKLLNAGHARLSADQHYFVDLAGVDARIFHALPAGSY